MDTIKATYQKFLEQVGEESFLEPYRMACRATERKLEDINCDYSKRLGRTFINQITYRIKTPESCLNKMVKKKYPVEIRTAQEKLNDISGVRVVCNFLDDIYKLMEILKEEQEFEVVGIKDYVQKPKASGYQSLHMIMLVPAGEAGLRKVEVQIRTQAMNFWAVVEHHFVYKKGSYERNEFEKDLKECARAIYMIDKKMLSIRKKMEVPFPTLT